MLFPFCQVQVLTPSPLEQEGGGSSKSGLTAGRKLLFGRAIGGWLHAFLGGRREGGGAFWRFFAGVFSAVSPAGPLMQETESLFPLGSDGSFLTLCPSDFTSRPFPLKSLHLLCGHPRPDEDGRLSAPSPPPPCPSSSPQEAPVGPFALTGSHRQGDARLSLPS